MGGKDGGYQSARLSLWNSMESTNMHSEIAIHEYDHDKKYNQLFYHDDTEIQSNAVTNAVPKRFDFRL